MLKIATLFCLAFTAITTNAQVFEVFVNEHRIPHDSLGKHVSRNDRISIRVSQLTNPIKDCLKKVNIFLDISATQNNQQQQQQEQQVINQDDIDIMNIDSSSKKPIPLILKNGVLSADFTPTQMTNQTDVMLYAAIDFTNERCYDKLSPLNGFYLFYKFYILQ